MAGFLGLPRELRDMIYEALITDEEPRPTLEKYCEQRRYAAYQYSFTPRQSRTTCAGFLASNRQIHEELNEAIERAHRKGLTSGKLDCLELFRPLPSACDIGVPCHLTWLRMPVVKTKREHATRPGGLMNSVFAFFWQRILWAAGKGAPTLQSASTRFDQLWVDVRLQPDLSRATRRSIIGYFRLGRAIIFALKHILEQGPNLSIPSGASPSIHFSHKTTIKEVVLNVVAEPSVGLEDEDASEMVNFQAQGLTEIWDRLWLGQWDEYNILLRRIDQVRICVNGETVRTRPLAKEWKRGNAEARYAATRTGF